MRRLLMFLLFLLLSPLGGCVATPLDLTEPVAGSYEVIGPAVGKTGGVLLFHFIPIAYNQRFKAAYDLAVQSKNADALINVTIEDSWWWGVVLNGNVTTIRGTAIRFNDKGPQSGSDEKTDANSAKKSDPEALAPPPKNRKPRRKN